MDQNGNIDFSGTDRITCTTNDVIDNVRRTQTYVWDQNSSDHSVLIREIRGSTDGLTNWQTVYRDASTPVTTTSQTSYSGDSRSTITTASDNSYTINAFSYGRLISSTRYDSLNSQLSSLNYSYDSQGRNSAITDARNGTTTYGYNNADLVTSVAAPLSQTTTTLYDNMMRPYSVIQPDGTTVNSSYLPTGELGLQYGSRTYPVGYGYDYAGRLQTMTNWSSYPSSGARVTTWNYDGQRGWLTNKTYDGGVAGPSYTYTYAGRLQTRKWARGITTTYNYNNGGSLTNVNYSDSTSRVTNTCDRLGRPIQIGGTSSTESLTYNLVNQIITDTQNGMTVTNVYDANLRRVSLGLRDSASLRFEQDFGYDATSRLSSVTNGDNTATYGYVDNSPLVGQITFKQNGNTRMTTSKNYDHLNRLTQISSAPSASSAVSFNYSYNSANQRTKDTLVDGS